jgi:hypothetical protein
MNLHHGSGSAQATSKPYSPIPNTFDTRVHGPWLVVVRGVWLLLVALTLGVFFASLPVYVAQLKLVCVGDPCPSTLLTPDSLRVLHHLGFSTSNYVTFSLILIVAEAVVWFAVSGVLAWRKSNDWLALLVALLLVLLGSNNVMNIVVVSHSLWQVPAQLCHFLSLVLLFLAFCLFPNGRFRPRWLIWPLVMWIAFQGLTDLFPNASYSVNTWPLPFTVAVWFSLFGTLVFAQIYRYVRVSNLVQREQTKWVVFGVVAVILGDFAIFVPLTVFPSLGDSLYGLASGQVFDVLVLLIPLSFGFAMLRFHLWDIDILINRTLVYGSLTAMLALIYIGLVIALQSIVRELTGKVAETPLVIVGSTLVIAALFNPLHRRIQAFIDRRFYRSKYDAVKTLEAFSATLRNEVDLSQLREHLLNVVQETMQPAHVSLWLRSPQPTAKHQGMSTSTPQEK